MAPGPTFERVYSSLKERLASGGYASGDRLDPEAIGRELFSSVTPVRDALHRLAGERIVEAAQGHGFRVPLLTEAGLREIYGWRSSLLMMALSARTPSRPAWQREGEWPSLTDGAGPIKASQIFMSVARLSGSPELQSAVANCNDRLALLDAAELWLLGACRNALDTLSAALQANDRTELRRGIISWHRIRQKAVPQLLVLAADRRTFPE